MPGRLTLTVVRSAVTRDRYGNDVGSGEPTEHDLRRCTLQPLIGSEAYDTSSATTRYQLFGPRDGDLLSSDQVRYDGHLYDVDGDVQRWPGRRGYLTAILDRAGQETS